MGVKRQKWEFFGCIVRAGTHKFAAKKTREGLRDAAAEQVLPPCRCIARIDPGESVPADAIACRWGGVINKIGRGAHLSRRLLPKVAFLFWGFVLKSAGSSLSAFEKRKKEADSKTGESNFGGK
jgi:hypothetical protein